MAVFVTGGYGQIGSWAVYYLAAQGHEIIIYDLHAPQLDYLERFADQITYIRGDVLDQARLAEAFEHYRGQIEGVIHTVGIMGEHVQLNPHFNVKLNVMGLVNVMETARVFGVKKVLYTSTGAVYGVVPQPVVAEDVLPNPTDLYAATKTASEFIGMQYANTFEMDFRISRVYFIYGPGKIPSNFINLYKISFGILEGIPNLKMEKGADQRLDFTYVRDAARGIVIHYLAETPEHQIYNIATGEAHSVGEAIAYGKVYTHFPVEVEVGPGVLMQRSEALDISRFADEFGFQPEYTLEDGIREYAEWLKAQADRKP